jgi:AcrR family transcriptional regulator
MPNPRRSDARRNRAAIVRAASDALTLGGENVASFRRIAELTGLGQATVYRHFPDRHALVAAVAQERMAELRGAVATCCADPSAFRPLLAEVLRTQAALRPLVDVVRRWPSGEQRRYSDQLLAILSGPFHRAREDGHLRAHVTLDHLALAPAMLEAAVTSQTGRPAREAAARRAIEVILDGLFRREAAG